MTDPRLLRVAPEIPVADMSLALGWYGDRLGFRTVMTMPDMDYAIVERDGAALHLFLDADAAPVGLHIFSTGIEALESELRDGGAELDQPLMAKAWGNRDFRLRDPFGNLLKFTEPTG
jgi:uncharacterized glyoxalase superfamily protein PhnB